LGCAAYAQRANLFARTLAALTATAVAAALHTVARRRATRALATRRTFVARRSTALSHAQILFAQSPFRAVSATAAAPVGTALAVGAVAGATQAVHALFAAGAHLGVEPSGTVIIAGKKAGSEALALTRRTNPVRIASTVTTRLFPRIDGNGRTRPVARAGSKQRN